ncbi:SDR family NAD(P)-dependent oxidoreductase [Phenylobacterium montanum]|uniref:SDR family NAD(P)-dependent oxidoreductase n=1 Tax=Phenylobacterium montanum TaxID=2823693 RepID=A0A975IWX8_9CAUL|nr:SDR family NAD(P)-dependent oxidoreductase [Caulobacter sp. S6]QUD90363.1 SDR family NAD(P)-dependent oxidoreductase [Caulobacter sp. S6]
MQDKVVVVTGAFGALGRVVIADAAARGAKVAALDFAPAAPLGLASHLAVGGVDLSEPEGAAKAIGAVVDHFGRMDALINVAGGFVWQTVAEGDAATWSRLYAMNVATTFNACKAALPHLVKSGGRIVNVGAYAALKADTGMGAYAASKSGVHRLTEALAAEYKGMVAVNAVLPSIIDTPANRADMPQADASKWVSPQDLASVILFLASDAARAVTGALVPVTGGV